MSWINHEGKADIVPRRASDWEMLSLREKLPIESNTAVDICPEVFCADLLFNMFYIKGEQLFYFITSVDSSSFNKIVIAHKVHFVHAMWFRLH